MPLVERLTIGSFTGSSGSFFTSASLASVESATKGHPSALISIRCQILNQGVTQTYLIVRASLRISFTGIASSTLTAKNWKVAYCNTLVRAKSFCSRAS